MSDKRNRQKQARRIRKATKRDERQLVQAAAEEKGVGSPLEVQRLMEWWSHKRRGRLPKGLLPR